MWSAAKGMMLSGSLWVGRGRYFYFSGGGSVDFNCSCKGT